MGKNPEIDYIKVSCPVGHSRSVYNRSQLGLIAQKRMKEGWKEPVPISQTECPLCQRS